MLKPVTPKEVIHVDQRRRERTMEFINKTLLDPKTVANLVLHESGGKTTYAFPLTESMNKFEVAELVSEFSEAGWGVTVENARIQHKGREYEIVDSKYLLLTHDRLTESTN